MNMFIKMKQIKAISNTNLRRPIMETVNLLTSLSKSTMSCLYSRLISMGVMISWGRCCSMRCKWSPWFSQPERGRLIVFRRGVCLWVKQSSCCAPWDRSSRESQRLREVLTEERDRELPGGSLFHFTLINGIPPDPLFPWTIAAHSFTDLCSAQPEFHHVIHFQFQHTGH